MGGKKSAVESVRHSHGRKNSQENRHGVHKLRWFLSVLRLKKLRGSLAPDHSFATVWSLWLHISLAIAPLFVVLACLKSRRFLRLTKAHCTRRKQGSTRSRRRRVDGAESMVGSCARCELPEVIRRGPTLLASWPQLGRYAQAVCLFFVFGRKS